MKIDLNKVKIRIEGQREINKILKNKKADRESQGKKYVCQEITMGKMMNQFLMRMMMNWLMRMTSFLMNPIMRNIILIVRVLLKIKDKVEANSKKGIEEAILTIILIIKNIGSIKHLQIKMIKINMTPK